MQQVIVVSQPAMTLNESEKMGAIRPGTREKAFAKRLDRALSMHPRAPDGYGRNTWLMRELTHANVTVSLETIRKWLAGEAVPRRAKMTALAKTLKVDESWLAMGVEQSVPLDSRRIEKLLEGLRQIEATTQDETVLEIVRNLLAGEPLNEN